MRKIVYIFFALLPASTFAQQSPKDKKAIQKARMEALKRDDEEGVIHYTRHFALGAKLISDGYGFFFEIGRAQSLRKTLLFQFEFDEKKSPKESKQASPFGDFPSIIYGKENFFYPIKLGVQQQVLLGNKTNKNGVCVTVNYGGGISLGLLRPYYAYIEDSTGRFRYAKYNSPDSIYFLDIANASYGLWGGPGFSQGWGDLSVIPGLYAKGALRFDYGKDNQVLSAIEVGIAAEIYSRKIPLVLYNAPKSLFLSVYAGIMFGGRH